MPAIYKRCYAQTNYILSQHTNRVRQWWFISIYLQFVIQIYKQRYQSSCSLTGLLFENLNIEDFRISAGILKTLHIGRVYYSLFYATTYILPLHRPCKIDKSVLHFIHGLRIHSWFYLTIAHRIGWHWPTITHMRHIYIYIQSP